MSVDPDDVIVNAILKRREGLMDAYMLMAMIVAIYGTKAGPIAPGEEEHFEKIIKGYEGAMNAICGMVANATDQAGDNAVQTVILKQRMENMMREFGFPDSVIRRSKSGLMGDLINSAISNLLTLDPKGELSSLTDDELAEVVDKAEGTGDPMIDFFSHLH
jgi:hypothetical protein